LHVISQVKFETKSQEINNNPFLNEFTGKSASTFYVGKKYTNSSPINEMQYYSI